MKIFISKTILDKVSGPGFYLRVSDAHKIELRMGRNSLNEPTLRLIGPYEKKEIKKTNNISHRYLVNNDQLILDFSLKNPDFSDLFFYFCDDLIFSSQNVSIADGHNHILNRYEKWRVFSKNSNEYLSENEIKRLIGELLFLEKCFLLYDSQTKAINAWTGSEPTKKDFSFEDYWYEIKVSTNRKVNISSLEQLDSHQLGYLVVNDLEKYSPNHQGITLNNLYERIYNMIELQSDKSEFLIKLIDAGYYQGEHYDKFVYELLDTSFFLVDEKFPKLTKTNIDPRISNASYSIELSNIQEFKKEIIK